MINGLDHAAIVTGRLAETTAFFVEALGLAVGFRPEIGIPGAWLYGAGGGPAVIHLLEDSAERPARSALDHVSLRTADLDGVLAGLERAGVKYTTIEIPGGLGRQAFCRDPNGVSIEIAQRPAA